MTRMPPKKVRLLMSKSSPRLEPPSKSVQGVFQPAPVHTNPNYLLTQIEQQYATGHFRSSLQISEDGGGNRASKFSDNMSANQVSGTSLGPRLLQSKPLTGYPQILPNGKVGLITGHHTRNEGSRGSGDILGAAILPAVSLAERRETTVPESP